MGRSVSYPYGSEIVCYQDWSYIEESYIFDDEIDYIRESLMNMYESLNPCDEWIDREDRAILENQFVYIGISEYCGLVAIWVTPKEDLYYYNLESLAKNWIDQIRENFVQSFSTLRRIGAFSNGVSIYEPIDQEIKEGV